MFNKQTMINMTKDQKFKNCGKYKKYYDNIIQYYREHLIDRDEIYCEIHHIIPQSLGGSNIKDNKVVLPYRVHVFVHECLFMYYKYSEDISAFKKMSAALHAMYSNLEHGRRKLTHSSKVAFFKQISRKNLINVGKKFTAFGKTLTLNEWAKETGIGAGTLYSRLRLGWSIEDAVSLELGTIYNLDQRKDEYRKNKYNELKLFLLSIGKLVAGCLVIWQLLKNLITLYPIMN